MIPIPAGLVRVPKTSIWCWTLDTVHISANLVLVYETMTLEPGHTTSVSSHGFHCIADLEFLPAIYVFQTFLRPGARQNWVSPRASGSNYVCVLMEAVDAYCTLMLTKVLHVNTSSGRRFLSNETFGLSTVMFIAEYLSYAFPVDVAPVPDLGQNISTNICAGRVYLLRKLDQSRDR